MQGLWVRFDDAAIRYRQDQGIPLASATTSAENVGTATGGNVTSNVQQRTPIHQKFMLGLNGTAAPGRVALDYALSVTQTELVRQNAGDITLRQTGLSMMYDRTDPTTPLINPTGAYPSGEQVCVSNVCDCESDRAWAGLQWFGQRKVAVRDVGSPVIVAIWGATSTRTPDVR